jgi:hypothetical protein
MTELSICFTGLSREDEIAAVNCFKQANASLGDRWLITSEAQAGVLVIDMDSIYGQMSLMKALGTGKVLVGLTEGARADTDFLLSRPLTATGLATLLGQIGGQVPSVAAPEPEEPAETTAHTPEPEEPAEISANTPEPADPGPGAEPAPEPVPDPPPAETADHSPRLADLLRPGALPGPVRLSRPDAPDLVLDPATRTYLGAAALKPLLPYLHAALDELQLAPVDQDELPGLAAALGGSQPWSRLVWLDALIGGHGALAAQAGPSEHFRLLRWPQIEREFPRHFRLATVMMKEPATITQIAALSGVPMAEVIDYVNACLATGVATGSAPLPAEPSRGTGLLGRLRR